MSTLEISRLSSSEQFKRWASMAASTNISSRGDSLSEIGDPQLRRYFEQYDSLRRHTDLAQGRSDPHRDEYALASHKLVDWENPKPIIEKVREEAKGDVKRAPHVTIIDDIARGPLGFFLLASRGLDGDHTDWLFNPNIRGVVPYLLGEDSFENFLLNGEVIFGPNQERFGYFQKTLRESIAKLRGTGAGPLRIGSWPCGRMRDLLDSPDIGPNDELYALDLDTSVFSLMEELAQLNEHDLTKIQSRAANAITGEGAEDLTGLDILLSNGLNHYLSDNDVKAMYSQAARLLRIGGIFITSHLAAREEFDPTLKNENPLAWERARSFSYIVQPQYLSQLRGQSMVTSQLEIAGFEVQKIIPGTYRIYPTYVAMKL